MVKVRMHIRENEQTTNWSDHKELLLSRVPCVGEHVALDFEKSPGFKVTLVNHYAFENDEGVAEIFVVPS